MVQAEALVVPVEDLEGLVEVGVEHQAVDGVVVQDGEDLECGEVVQVGGEEEATVQDGVMAAMVLVGVDIGEDQVRG